MVKVIGYMRCPVCGRKTDIRENKNGILYTYCPYNHHAKLSRDDSEDAKNALFQGQQWNNGVIYLYPEQKQQLTERTKENDGNNGTITGTTTDTPDIGRRIDGQFATNSAVGNATTDTSDSDGDDWDGECGLF